jgi:hypothetical protein
MRVKRALLTRDQNETAASRNQREPILAESKGDMQKQKCYSLESTGPSFYLPLGLVIVSRLLNDSRPPANQASPSSACASSMQNRARTFRKLHLQQSSSSCRWQHTSLPHSPCGSYARKTGSSGSLALGDWRRRMRVRVRIRMRMRSRTRSRRIRIEDRGYRICYGDDRCWRRLDDDPLLDVDTTMTYGFMNDPRPTAGR